MKPLPRLDRCAHIPRPRHPSPPIKSGRKRKKNRPGITPGRGITYSISIFQSGFAPAAGATEEQYTISPPPSRECKAPCFRGSGVLYFATVKTPCRFSAAPRTGNAINIIVHAMFNALYFKPIQAAVISDTFPAFAILSFIHRSNPFQNGML